MKKLYLLILVALFAIGVGFAISPQAPGVELSTTRVAGSIYLIHGHDNPRDSSTFSGGNIAVSVGDDGVAMIDSKMGSLSAEVKAALASLSGDTPRYLINTHAHGDHVGGNALANGTIIAHANVRQRVMGDNPEDVWPVLTFENSVSLHVNGEEIKAIHVPAAHTDGDAVVYFVNSNVIHMGDLYFSGILPFVDLESGGTVQGYLKNFKMVLDKTPNDAKIIPGHGPLSSKDDMVVNYRMLTETTSLVTKKMKAGMSLEAIKTEGLQPEWQSWGWFFISPEKWIETIYNSYSDEITSK